MTRDLSRLLNPRSIAVVGGGAWCAAIIGAARRIGFEGDIFPVHPDGKEIAGLQSFRALSDWPGPIDAAFIGLNRRATLGIVETLKALDAGGAICFASGFSEAEAEDSDGRDLQAALVSAAGKMPILGPNCYGFVNALDRVAIWPDQHGMMPVDCGVAILTQSSNIAINLTMQRRGVPLAMVVTCGNSAQTSQAALARRLLEDDRITAIGLHIEGFGDLREWEDLARIAYARHVPLVAVKVGRSDQARHATVSHTASLAGSDAGAQALLDRLGIARVDDLPSFLETLKLLHVNGPLPTRRMAAISCSGGEASLIADMAMRHGLQFPPLTDAQKPQLRAALGPMVALANPLDYHTYVWRDAEAMGRAWAATAAGDADVTVSVVDYPHTDAADWICATQAAKAARATTGRPFVVAASLPELMPEDVAFNLMAGDVVPMAGLAETLAAIRAATDVAKPDAADLLLPNAATGSELVPEARAKRALAGFGLDVPNGREAKVEEDLMAACASLNGPLAFKGQGLAHKTEAGAVRLGLTCADLPAAAQDMGLSNVLIEEMVIGAVAELLIGVTCDPAHGFVLTLGAGGVLTELMADSVSTLLPVAPAQIASMLEDLRIGAVLDGYRGKPGADTAAIVQAVLAIQDYVTANADQVKELEINPLICTTDRAVAADAVILLGQGEVS